MRVISQALDFALQIDRINHNMTAKIDVDKAKESLAYLGGHDYSAEERTIDSIGQE